ncbi:MAG TPA: TIGR01777 family oxidoreductase, partial [Thermoanaerobaculia bacterium]|nr:TIGR01777 family oxidoreductase [Thermoanaerobaculia bacterium]
MTGRDKVLITGGSGLIGSALTAELAGAGYEVVVLSRSPERVTGLPAGARAVGWDAETADGWGPEAEGARAVVNLAGENLATWPWTEATKRRILASRLDATRAVVLALEGALERASERPPVLIQASGIDLYGPQGDDDEPVDEDDPVGEGFLAHVTREWEAASAPAESLGVRRVCLRTAMVLASEGGALPKLALPFRLGAGGPVGSGRQWVSWIHLRDEVRAIRFLLERPEASGPFNLTAPEPVRNRELAKALGRVLRRPALFRAP